MLPKFYCLKNKWRGCKIRKAQLLLLFCVGLFVMKESY